VNNYYTENYYSNYNQTFYNETYYSEENYYGNNETEIDYTKPLEIHEFTNLTLDEYFADLVYNMSSENTIFIMSNEINPSFTISYVLDSMIDYFYAGYPCFIDGNQPNQAKWWSPPNYNTWHVIFKNDAALESVKVYIEIL